MPRSATSTSAATSDGACTGLLGRAGDRQLRPLLRAARLRPRPRYPTQVAATGGTYRYMEREVPDTFNMIADYPQKLTVLCNGTQGNDLQSPGSGEQPIIRGWDGTMTFEGGQIVVRPTGGSTKGALAVPIAAGTDDGRFWREFPRVRSVAQAARVHRRGARGGDDDAPDGDASRCARDASCASTRRSRRSCDAITSDLFRRAERRILTRPGGWLVQILHPKERAALKMCRTTICFSRSA